MASRSSIKKAKTTIDDSPSERPTHRNHDHTLEVDEHSDAAIVGSSRRRRISSTSRDTTGRSTSPAGVNRTRTGRVSKAAKGQPVHHCHCGKTYTRAEHLRRHQQNHKPGAFPCDIQGCGRAFYREDLLTRHKMKHDEAPESPGFLASRGSGSEPDLLAPSKSPPTSYKSEVDPQEVVPVPELGACDVDSRASQQQSGTGTRKNYIPIAELHPPAIGLTVDHARIGFARQNSWGLDPSPFNSFGSGYNTPEQGYQTYGQPHVTPAFDNAQSWTTDVSSLYVSHSPTSRNSMTPTPLGRRPSLACTQLRTPNSDTSTCDARNRASFLGDPYLSDASGIDNTILPEYRDMLEQDELVTPTSAPQAANFGPNQYRHRLDNEQRYLEAFWHSVHPAWPILHRPTLDPTRASPLLRAAMITLGAHSTGIAIDSGNACILHKRCLKVIRKRTVKTWHSHRVEDMQAMFLVELFAITRSRRPPLQLSKPFVDAYHHSAKDYDTDTTNALFAAFNSFDSLHETPENTCTLEAESTRRLLIACYILDIQHSTFFGREATEIPDFDPVTLSLPQPLHLWDLSFTPQAASWGETHCEHFVTQLALPCATVAVRLSDESLDIFTSMLLIAYTNSRSDNGEIASTSELPTTIPSSSSSSHSPHIQLAHQTFKLSTKVPIRALLAVAGESWIQAEKLSSKADYIKAQADIRDWATMTSSAAVAGGVASALPLAVEIIRLHRQHPKRTFLFHEWSLHLAVLVVWAKVYGNGRGRKQQALRLLVPTCLGTSTFSSAPAVSGLELDGFVAGLVNDAGSRAGAAGISSWQDAKQLLMWAKGRLEKGGIARFCGVVSGAVNVLEALVDRGDEDGWF